MMRWKVLCVILFVTFNAEVGAKNVREDLLNDLSQLEDEVAELSRSLQKKSSETGIVNELKLENNQEKNAEDAIYDEMEQILEDAESEITTIDMIAAVNSFNAQDNGEMGLHDVDIKDWYGNTSDESGNVKRNAVRDNKKLWSTRDIPYVFESNFNSKGRQAVRDAIATFKSVSCIKFHPRQPNENPYILIFHGPGCYSYVGKVSSGKQDLSLGIGCESKGTALHEFLHALGFFHEQSRYDRDTYIKILWENIRTGAERNFEKKTIQETRNLQSPYDYRSIMHYGKRSFTRNGKNTIEVIENPNAAIGLRGQLSQVDIDTLNRMYHCNDTLQANTWTQWSNFGLCHYFSKTEYCHKRRYRFCPDGNCSCPNDNCNVEAVFCPLQNCTVDGHWGAWTPWTNCAGGSPCMNGTKQRTRKCDDPPAVFGGQPCAGPEIEVAGCRVICPQNCTFTEDYCGYTISGAWTRIRGSTPSLNTGPTQAVDGILGYYVYTEVSGGLSAGFESTLLSPSFNASNTTQCFSWYYHMYGQSVGDLAVYLKVNGIETEIWKKTGSLGNEWKKAVYELTATDPFQIYFVSKRGISWSGDIALDNLVLTKGLCPLVDGQWGKWLPWTVCVGNGHCTKGTKHRTRKCDNPPPQFGAKPCVGSEKETSDCFLSCPTMCTFDNGYCGYAVSGAWKTNNGATPSSGTGPNQDVDNGGYYIYTEASGGSPGYKSTLLSPLFNGSSNPQCFSWYYHMYGKSIGNITAYFKLNNVDTQIWSKSGEQGNKWKKVEYSVLTTGPFRIYFVSHRGVSWSGDIALDNLFLESGVCASTNTTKSPVITTTNAKTVATTAPVKTVATTAPVKTVATTAPVKTVATTAPAKTVATTAPLKTVATTAPVKTVATTAPVKTVATTAPVKTVATTAPVKTVATTAPVVTTRKPVITMTTKEPMGTTRKKVPVTKNTTKAPVTKPTTAPSAFGSIQNFKCSFKGSLCGMQVWKPYTTSNSVQWRRDNKGYLLEDRAVERGHFLVLRAESNEDIGKTSFIITPVFQEKRNQDVEFYYFMAHENIPYGRKHDKMGLLEVSMVDHKTGDTCVIFSTTTARNGVWEYGRAKVVVKRGQQYYLKFSALLTYEDSTIAIDDIQGLGWYPKTSTLLKSPTIMSCSFNSAVNGLCSWKSSGEFDWQRSNGASISAVTQRLDDHIVFADAQRTQMEGDLALLTSPLLYSRKPTCMVFFSNVAGYDIGSLRVNVTRFKDGKRYGSPITRKLINSPGKWRENRINLPSYRSFKVQFIAKLGKGLFCGMAIDNILVLPGRCRIHRYEPFLLCDFENVVRCGKFIKDSNNFHVTKDPGSSFNKYSLANKWDLDVTMAELKLLLKDVDQFGACILFQYRVKLPKDYDYGFVHIKIYQSSLGEIHVIQQPKIKILSTGTNWKMLRVNIPPIAAKENLVLVLRVNLIGPGMVEEFSIDNIRMLDGICY